MNMLLDSIYGSSGAYNTTPFISKNEVEVILSNYEAKIKSLFKSMVVDISRRIDDTLKSISFNFSKQQNVAKEHKEILVNTLEHLKESISLKVQVVDDKLSMDVKSIGELSSGVQKTVDNLISNVKTLLENIRVLSVEYKFDLVKKEAKFIVVFDEFKNQFNALEKQVFSLVQTSSSTTSTKHVSKALLSIKETFKSQISLVLDLVVRI